MCGGKALMVSSVAALVIMGLMHCSKQHAEFFPMGVYNPPFFENADTVYYNQVSDCGFNMLRITTRGKQQDPRVYL